MLSSFVDRIWAPSFLYLAFAAAVWYLRHVAYSTLAYALLAFLSVHYAHKIINVIISERKLDALGKRSPRITDYSPFGLWTLFEAIWYFSHHRNDELWWKWFLQNGNPKNPYTVETFTVGERIIFTSDDENVKAILATQFQDFGKGPQFQKEWNDFLGHSIFTTDGELWHSSRALLRPQFIKDRVSDLHKFETNVQVLLPLLEGGGTIRIDDLFYRFSLDAATDFLLGKSVGSLQHKGTEFGDAFAEVQRVQALIARAGPLNTWVPKASFYRGLEVLNRFVNQYIDQALKLPPEELEKITKSDEGYTFLHALASYTRDRQVLRDQLIAVLLAGRDTTAVTLSWLFYELSRRPNVVQKIREEILNTIGLDRTPTYADIKSMRYLQHVFNETLRLYPVVPFNVRVAMRDTTLPRGGGRDGNEPVSVLKDTPIGYSTFVMQRRPDIYPDPSTGFPDYLDFVPERWEYWTPKIWTYAPFNGGPRICIGQQFALMEMSYLVIRIFQKFSRVESRQNEFPMFRSDIVLQPAKGVKVAFYQGG